MRKHGHAVAIRPGAQARAGRRHQMLDHGGSEHLQEEILVGLPFLPELSRVRFELRAGADGDDDCAVRSGAAQRGRKTRARERHTIQDDLLAVAGDRGESRA